MSYRERKKKKKQKILPFLYLVAVFSSFNLFFAGDDPSNSAAAKEEGRIVAPRSREPRL